MIPDPAVLMNLVALVALAVPPTDAPEPPDEPQAEVSRDDQTEQNIDNRVLGTGTGENFTMHRMNYAAIGGNDAKMQFSLKYKMVSTWNLFIAYTNVVVWDIYEESYPYRDINFIPEVFWRFQPKDDWWTMIDVGYLHNSNGQDGDLSRAWDRFVARTGFKTTLADRPLHILPSVWLTLSESGNNPDIEDYLGYWDVGVHWRRLLDPEEENLDFYFILNSGDNGVPFDRGFIETGLKYTFSGYTFNPSLLLQYFNGYGNSILEYNRKRDELRFGIVMSY